LSGVDALWDCVPRACGGGVGCAGGGVLLGAVPALSWCGEVCLGGEHVIIITGVLDCLSVLESLGILGRLGVLGVPRVA